MKCAFCSSHAGRTYWSSVSRRHFIRRCLDCRGNALGNGVWMKDGLMRHSVMVLDMEIDACEAHGQAPHEHLDEAKTEA